MRSNSKRFMAVVLAGVMTAMTIIPAYASEGTAMETSGNEAVTEAVSETVAGQSAATTESSTVSADNENAGISADEVSADAAGSEDIPVDETHFPDANFRTVIETTSIDYNTDNKLTAEEIAQVKTIDCSNQGISDLTGIEYFTALTNLSCNGNELTSLDVSKLTNLTSLNCTNNELSSLDISNNIALTELNCSNNPLSSLDVSKNTALTRLTCANNPLSSLDVSKNTALTQLTCYSNQLSSLDVSKNTALMWLWCASNQLSSLDVSKNTALTDLLCGSNKITSLDVSRNTALTQLDCFSNQLSSLDVSKNTALTQLWCASNLFTTLDLRNNLELKNLNISSMPSTFKVLCTSGSYAETYCKNNKIAYSTGGGTTPVTPGAASYTVTFDPQGGSAVASSTVSSGDALVLPAAPTRDGYTFGGWFTAAGGHGTQYSNGTVINANTTLYAYWISAETAAKLTDISAATISPIKDQSYTGSAIKPAITVKNGKTKLEEGVDYTVSYSDNVNAGNAKATVNGIGNYTGTNSAAFTIVGKRLTTGAFEFTTHDVTLSGDRTECDVQVYDRTAGKYLTKDTDFDLIFTNCSKVGTAKATVTGRGNYTGRLNRTYSIYPAGTALVGDTSINLTDGDVIQSFMGYELQSAKTVASLSYTYDGCAKRPTVTIKDTSDNTIDKKNYSVSYKNNKNAGLASVTVSGKKKFKGTATVYFTINAASVTGNITVSNITDKTYTGSQIKPSVTVKLGKKKLARNREYSLVYSDNVEAGTATVTVKGIGNYAGNTASKTFHILQKDMKRGLRVTGLTAQKATGSQIKPSDFKVYCGKHMLLEGRDYTLTYGDNTAAGKGTVTLTAVAGSSFTGSVTKSFKIKK